LVTGFLGAGKTTLLGAITRRQRQRRLVYLVNEFSTRDIDGAIVSESNPDVVCVPGGSIFCKCLVTQFIAQLQSIPARFGLVEGLVIEASGMANPKVMASMLHETRLDQQYRLARIISVIDPGSFHKLRQTLPTITAQIEASDLALINKADLYEVTQIQETADALRSINPGLEIQTCVRGEADVELFGAPSAPSVIENGSLAPCRDPLYDTVTLTPAGHITHEQLRMRLLDVETEIYRLKGYLPTEGGSVYVDYSTAGFEVSPSASSREPVVVLIHAGNPAPRTREFIAWLGQQA
jgi:G3E family GTPase